MGENGVGKSSLIESVAEAYGLLVGGGDARVIRSTLRENLPLGRICR